MCVCRPEVRTPFCGRPGCTWPEQVPAKTEVPARPSEGVIKDLPEVASAPFQACLHCPHPLSCESGKLHCIGSYLAPRADPEEQIALLKAELAIARGLLNRALDPLLFAVTWLCEHKSAEEAREAMLLHADICKF